MTGQGFCVNACFLFKSKILTRKSIKEFDKVQILAVIDKGIKKKDAIVKKHQKIL